MFDVQLPRDLDLREPADIELLSEAIHADSQAAECRRLLPLWAEWAPSLAKLDRYASAVMVDVGDKHTMSLGLQQLLEIAARLEELAEWPGFDRLVASFANRTQVRETAFEIEAAHWCSTRQCSRALSFATPVHNRRGSDGVVDFTWSTAAGVLAVECKLVQRLGNNKARRRLEYITSLVASLEAQWPDDLRFELRCESLSGNVATLLDTVLAHLQRAPARLQLGGLDARLVPRTSPLATDLGNLVNKTINVGPTATPLVGPDADRHTSAAVGIDTDPDYMRSILRNLKEARQQLPHGEPGMVIIGCERPPAALVPHLQEIIAGNAFESTPAVALFDGTAVTVVTRSGQPFEGETISAPTVT